MTDLVLLEPETSDLEWAPFAGVRPVCELRAGIWRVRERWEQVLGARASAIVGAHVAGFVDDDAAPPVQQAAAIRGPAIVARSDFVPSLEPVDLSDDTRCLAFHGKPVAWLLDSDEPLDAAPPATPALDVNGMMLGGSVALLDALDSLLALDCAAWSAQAGASTVPAGSLVLGDPSLIAAGAAQVEPGVVFDVRHGAIVLDAGAEVRHGARLEGPLYVGPHSIVWGGVVKHSVIGPHCRVRGEVTHSIFLGYANKAHDGFVGHSVLGHWVNLGALTTTSNLKNTYGMVALNVAGTRIATNRQFVGTLFGDHVKTAIGTMLGTGTVVGAGANLFGSGAVPKWVPPFTWGNAARERMDEAAFLKVAGRAMPRRGVELTAERRASLSMTYARTTGA